ncbi:conserved hypothetical protein [Candida tropicalis MYA-3404]|uniref:Uncharacterized protein n=1 Tax=Candida tropicalis (strain ATCC MYA-3404 / T1) TaxID=294747 RepID=C5MDD2_CANTT|nr:conserved hypothetical protein [Candida tropicalis MYA-3404]EER32562.1 conserved hypothetical protein [Candida tropicalis MYA-3404]KAG4406186.1 hypothetical protein JTP64_005057 [Candida tropicalis]
MTRQTTYIHNLIAQYLQDNNYPETLKQFENEHGTAIQPSKLLDESLDEIIDDRIQYSSLLDKIEAIDVNEELHDDLKQIIKDEFNHWITPFPQTPRKLVDIAGLVLGSCYSQGLVYFSSNDSNVHVVKEDIICKTIKMPVVIKNILTVGDDKIILVGMNGTLYLRHSENLDPISEFQAHKRLIVDARYKRVGNVDYIVSLGWDFFVRLIKLDEENNFSLLSELKLQQQGSCIDVVEYQNELVIVLGKLENTLLDVLAIRDNQLTLLYKISLNDAEFTAAGFSPRLLTIHQAAIPLIAVATSHEPFMRLIIVPLSEAIPDTAIKRNQIIKNLNTLSPQDKYSQPIIAWRLCRDENDRASGVWVMGDDGVIRGLDIIDDKVVIELNEGHQGKIKDFISFIDGDGVEKLVTSGIDREIIEWK